MDKMKKMKLLLMGCIFLIISCTQKNELFETGDDFVNDVKEMVNGITVAQAKTMMDTASFYMLIDVREAEEYHPGYIPGSVNIPRGVLEFNVANDKFWESKSLYTPYRTDMIFVYCKKGKRSILAASTLEKMGYTNVKYLEGGFKQWELSYPNDYERDEIEHGHAEEAEEVGGC